MGVAKTTVLDDDEIVTEFRVPTPPDTARSAFIKFATRDTIDFPIVNCAAMISTSKNKVETARICLNAAYVIPYRVRKAEEALVGKAINEKNGEAAGAAAVSNSKAVRHNRYMVQIAKTLVKRTILACK